MKLLDLNSAKIVLYRHSIQAYNALSQAECFISSLRFGKASDDLKLKYNDWEAHVLGDLNRCALRVTLSQQLSTSAGEYRTTPNDEASWVVGLSRRWSVVLGGRRLLSPKTECCICVCLFEWV